MAKCQAEASADFRAAAALIRYRARMRTCNNHDDVTMVRMI
jgi:hypothetical protein